MKTLYINRIYRVSISIVITCLVLISMLVGCAPAAPQPAATDNTSSQNTSTPIIPGKARFKIATTTSLYDTGLWNYLEPMFEKKANVELDIVYAGTGIALEYGRRGDVDAVVVHDPAAEAKFIAEGYGINKRSFAFNHFLIAGPDDDPVGIKGLTPEQALKKIYEAGVSDPTKVKFISRGDNSGTHSKEKLIWKAAGLNYEDVQKSGPWYIEAGKGMGPCLLMASEEGAYILCDISTFLAFKGKVDVAPLVEQGDLFLNVYSVIEINPEKIKTAKMLPTAKAFTNWLISDEVQDLIGNYGVAEYGRSLFNPLKGGGCIESGCPKLEDYTVPVE
ncbi:MAG: substrate-binding domain-containing protein [Dehalococcoidia bacterium]|nr:substrate-binding domain-containing protein [Dehalococcoidia bacterium]